MKTSYTMLLLTCVLVFSACGHQQKQSSILNPTSEQLDSLENIVLNSPDAQLRREARMSAIDLGYRAYCESRILARDWPI